MKLKKIKFKNLGSYGNNENYIEFNLNNGELNLISGQNGAGKSTIVDAIKYAIYGKLANKNIKDFENRFNKGGYVELEFIINDVEYKIERGTNNIFNLYKNGEQINQFSKLELQKYFEENILKIDYKVFSNSFCISLLDFKSILSLSSKDKKDILDKIFQIDILNKLSNEFKNVFKNIEKEIQIIEVETNSIKENLEKLKNITNENSEELENYKNELSKIELELTELNNKKLKLKEKQEGVQNKLNEYQIKITKLNYALNEILKKKEFYDLGKCPTCGTELTSELHLNTKKEFEEKIEKLKSAQTTINENIKTHNELIKKLKIANESTTNKIIELNKKIQELNNKLTQSNISQNVLNIINEYQTKLETKIKELETKKIDYEIYKELTEIFSEDGVKLYIKKNILSVLNREIEIILQIFNLNYYSLIIDEYFDSKIYFHNVEISPESLSAGEKKRLEFILIVSLLKFIQMNLLNINVLFLDEIFASIDNYGIEDIIKILKYLKTKLNLNIFLIHHSIVFESEFDKIYLIKKENNFSKIELLKL